MFHVMLFLFCTYISEAQIVPKIWYFGRNAGIDFNSNPPKPITSGNHSIQEGGVTITDENGDVLFYVDENTVYNRINLPMKNGAGFIGNTGSSAQSPIAIQVPGNKNQVYIFYVADHLDDNLIGQLRYSIIDLCGDDGKGEILANKKNIRVPGKYTERLTVAYNKEKNFYWVLVSDFSSQVVKAFKLDESGLATSPVSSSLNESSQPSYIGMMNLSLDNKKLAYTCGLSGGFRGVILNDFDVNTGVLSNSEKIYFGDIYDAVFSASGRYLYITDVFATCKLLKLDLVNDQVKTLYEIGGNYAIGCVEMGPDNSIYVAMPGINAVGQIKNPDLTNETFMPNFIEFSMAENVSFGLQSANFFFGIINETVLNNNLGNDTSICGEINLILDSGLPNAKWSDGTQNRYLQIKEEGTYFFYYRSCNKLYTDTINVIKSKEKTFSNYKLIEKCENETINLVASFSSSWNTGQFGEMISVAEQGLYIATTSEACTKYIDSFQIKNLLLKELDLGPDLVSCKIEPFYISIDPNYRSYNWSNGVTTFNNILDKEGTYWVEVVDICNNKFIDSISYILDKNIKSDTTFLNFSILPGEIIQVNSFTYQNEGRYYQILENIFGCDSLLAINIVLSKSIINYDFNKCIALIGSSNMDYSEFEPNYLEKLDCGNVSAGILYRENGNPNKHSCTPGMNGSLAMCIGAHNDCQYNSLSDKAVIIEIKLDPSLGKSIILDGIQFYQKAPENFDWVGGDKGLNNYPTKYGIRVLKNGVEVFSSVDHATSRDWHLEKFNFSTNVDFEVSESTTFRFEILPYCVVGNQAIVNAWDLENVAFFGTCTNKKSRSIAGLIFDGSGNKMENVIVQNNNDIELKITNTNKDGFFSFSKNSVFSEYRIKPIYDKDWLNGVSTLDLILMQRHILGIQPFKYKKQFVSADIDNNRKISAADILALRKLILGIDSRISSNTSWRFLPIAEVENNSDNFVFNEEYLVQRSILDENTLDFIAIKVGDLNGDVTLNNISNRTTNEYSITLKKNVKGNLTYLTFYGSELNDVSGIQIGLDFGNLRPLKLINGEIEFKSNEYVFSDSGLKLSKIFETARQFGNKVELFTLVFENSSDFSLVNLKINRDISEIYSGVNLDVSRLSLTNKSDLSNLIIELMPNPFTDVLELILDSNLKGITKIEIYDIQNKLVLSKEINLNSGNNEVYFDRNNFNSLNGLYFLKVSNDNMTQVKKILMF